MTRRRPIAKLLVANRGEIAVRVIRAARELGIETVAVYSAADRNGLAVQLADAAVDIGPSQATKSYLDRDAILAAARESGADAVHPGYGFLAENADFADAVEAAGLTFVGPAGDTIRLVGDKALARRKAAEAHVPTVPGSDGPLDDPFGAEEIAAQIGFPLLVKAAAGGGGRGIRIVADAGDLARQIGDATREAQAAFGDGRVYLERFVSRARHIEVQVLGDGERVVHLFERECSLQRRRQKIFEETPAPGLSEDLRERLCAAAVRLAASVAYRGAGTVEFLYDRDRDELYFIEMNARIQVEHPITEMVTGIDLVREMLLVAGGEPLRLRQGDIVARGSAIECRINAEDPARGFAPSPGTIASLRFPAGPGIRVDSMLFWGCTVPPFYDSLLAKVIAWDETRDRALARMRRALFELQIDGVATTAALHARLLDDPGVIAGDYDTNYLERLLTKEKQ